MYNTTNRISNIHHEELNSAITQYQHILDKLGHRNLILERVDKLITNIDCGNNNTYRSVLAGIRRDASNLQTSQAGWISDEQIYKSLLEAGFSVEIDMTVNIPQYIISW